MFARHGSAQAEGAFRHAAGERLGGFQLIVIATFHQEDRVEIAVPDMAEDRAGQARCGDVGAGFGDRLRQLGHGDANVGDKAHAAGA